MIPQSSTVSDKYRVMIPSKIWKASKINKGQKIDWSKALAGVAKGTWSGIDAQEYINKLRDEWE